MNNSNKISDTNSLKILATELVACKIAIGVVAPNSLRILATGTVA